MAKPLLRFLRDDLSEALRRGSERLPARSAAGEAWLWRWFWVSVIAALSLFLAGGYHAGFERLNAVAATPPSWIWAWLTVIGDERMPFALILLLSLRWPRIFWAMLLSALFAVAFTHLGKQLFDALRPAAVLDAGAFNLIGPELRRTSFPSGHSATAALFFATCVYYARNWRWRTLLTLIAVAAGLSRVAVGVHWPLDVAVGLTCGVLAALIGTRLAARWPGGMLDLSTHLAFIFLCAVMTSTLLYWDGGYREAAPFLQFIAAVSLSVMAVEYLFLPLWRWRRSTAQAG